MDLQNIDLEMIKQYLDRMQEFIPAILTLAGGLVVIFIIRRVLFKRLRRWFDKPNSAMTMTLFAKLERIITAVLFLGVLYEAAKAVHLGESVENILSFVFPILTAYLLIRLVTLIVVYMFHLYVRKDHAVQREAWIQAVMPVIQGIIWIIGLVILLENLGFEISTLVAGLGIAGVAVGLAGQAMLSDFFSYVAVLFDRPWEIGDFIITGDILGTVEHIGLKTTRLRSLSGELIIIANSDLTGARVRNYKRMQRRRVLFTVGVTYQTTSEQLKEIPQLMREIIEEQDRTEFDRSHFKQYGDSGLIIETVYFVLSPDYNIYMDVHHQVNVAIKERFEARGIEFAYPTRTLYLNSDTGQAAEPVRPGEDASGAPESPEPA